jgi:FecR protein
MTLSSMKSIFGVTLLLTMSPFAGAQTAPSTTPAAQTEQLQIVVTDVQGTVRVRQHADQPWQPATVNMTVGEDAEFRTGPRSSVTAIIQPDQQFTLDRLGTVSVLEAIKEGKTVKTDLALKYGRVRLDVEAAGVEHRSVIRSPSSTLAVRGTQVSLYDQPPFAPVAQSFTGRAMFGYAKRIVPVGGSAFAKALAGTSGAAETAKDESTVDPRFSLALSETDQRLIDNETSRGAVLSFDPIANINVIRGGAGPLPDSQFATNPPGAANFFLRWTGNADLNLTVTLQQGNAENILLSANFQPTEILYPGYSLDNTKSGGHIAFDHRGGPNGGTETGYWKNVVPGLYGVSARNISGAPADLKFNVVVDGKPLNIFVFANTDFGLAKGTQIERTLKPGEEVVGLVPVPASALFNSIIPDDTGPQAAAAVTASAKTKSSKTQTTTVKPQISSAGATAVVTPKLKSK